MPPPIAPYRFVVPQHWCDYNGHCSDGYYLVAFSSAADKLLDAVGLGAGYRAQGDFSAYTVESHVRYLKEGKAGDELAIEQTVRDCDARRMWIYQEMLRDGALLATCQCLYLHVDASVPKVAPFPAAVLERIARVMEQGAEWAGRAAPPAGRGR